MDTGREKLARGRYYTFLWILWNDEPQKPFPVSETNIWRNNKSKDHWRNVSGSQNEICIPPHAHQFVETRSLVYKLVKIRNLH